MADHCGLLALSVCVCVTGLSQCEPSLPSTIINVSSVETHIWIQGLLFRADALTEKPGIRRLCKHTPLKVNTIMCDISQGFGRVHVNHCFVYF